jgi:hypothetical protein
MTVFKTNRCGYEIEAVIIEKSTDHFVFLPPDGRYRARRKAKASDWGRYWDTQEEAQSHIIQRATLAIEQAERTIEKATKALRKLGVEI